MQERGWRERGRGRQMQSHILKVDTMDRSVRFSWDLLRSVHNACHAVSLKTGRLESLYLSTPLYPLFCWLRTVLGGNRCQIALYLFYRGPGQNVERLCSVLEMGNQSLKVSLSPSGSAQCSYS